MWARSTGCANQRGLEILNDLKPTANKLLHKIQYEVIVYKGVEIQIWASFRFNESYSGSCKAALFLFNVCESAFRLAEFGLRLAFSVRTLSCAQTRL